MVVRTKVWAMVLGLAVVAVSCTTSGSGGEDSVGASPFPDGAFAIRANADIGIGPARVLFAVGDETGRRLGGPDAPIEIAVHPLDHPEEEQVTDGIWTWIIDGALGLYRAEFDFDTPGIFEAILRPRSGEALPPVAFEVVADPSAPAVGELAPTPETPTIDDFAIEELTTDLSPDPSFYALSLDEAIANGRPTVVVFSTPAFCQTATCGPLLDTVQDMKSDFPNVDFVHVEVYTNLTDPDFAPVPENLSPAVREDFYDLPSEPWVFVIDEFGIVKARFEGVMAPDELISALR